MAILHGELYTSLLEAGAKPASAAAAETLAAHQLAIEQLRRDLHLFGKSIACLAVAALTIILGLALSARL